MKAYPGKAKKLDTSGPNIIFNQSKMLNNWTSFTLPRDYQLKNSFYESDFYHGESKRPKSHIFRRQYSQEMFDALGEDTYELFQDAIHSPNHKDQTTKLRSVSVDSKPKPVLSRRQILASLEEENSFGSSSSSGSRWSSSTPSSSPSEPMFSRSCLIQSISHDEENDSENSERFADTSIHKCDSSGENIDISDTEEYGEQETDDSIEEWDDASHWYQQQDHDQDVDCDQEYQNISLKSLKWVATLGVGGFGRVELVTCGQNKNNAFALKKMKKSEIQDTKQQQHILNEKMIMQTCNSPFIVKLYKTFHDNKFLYMLMEPCLGGELWTLLRRSKRFSDSTALFYVACVILAFDYLHDRGIIYRDLKPENLLLDSTGYVKLTDFGFSRKLNGGEQAWTFCGTPEYVAPEIITNKSHDFRADIWSLGILVYELLTGAPPFTKQATSGQVYPEILKGMKSVHFPSCIGASASEIIRQCCRLSANQRPSLAHLKYFMWFSQMDWVGLADRTLTPPNVPTIASNADHSNFDTYPVDFETPNDDFSEWSNDF